MEPANGTLKLVDTGFTFADYGEIKVGAAFRGSDNVRMVYFGYDRSNIEHPFVLGASVGNGKDYLKFVPEHFDIHGNPDPDKTRDCRIIGPWIETVPDLDNVFGFGVGAMVPKAEMEARIRTGEAFDMVNSAYARLGTNYAGNGTLTIEEACAILLESGNDELVQMYERAVKRFGGHQI